MHGIVGHDHALVSNFGIDKLNVQTESTDAVLYAHRALSRLMPLPNDLRLFMAAVELAMNTSSSVREPALSVQAHEPASSPEPVSASTETRSSMGSRKSPGAVTAALREPMHPDTV